MEVGSDNEIFFDFARNPQKLVLCLRAPPLMCSVPRAAAQRRHRPSTKIGELTLENVF